MARSARAREMMDQETRLDMTPIIDVTFNLLIFFMCMLRFKTLEGKLLSYLPLDQGVAAVRPVALSEDVEIVLRVPRDQWERPPLEREVQIQRQGSPEPLGIAKRVAFRPGREGRAEVIYDPPDAPERIKRWLAGVRKRLPGVKARIHASPRTPHLHVVSVLNLMLEAGFEEISYTGIPASLIRDLESGALR